MSSAVEYTTGKLKSQRKEGRKPALMDKFSKKSDLPASNSWNSSARERVEYPPSRIVF
jgi:hypothetical protein